MSAAVKKGTTDCALTVTCESCKTEYPWAANISGTPKEILFNGKPIGTRTTFTVKCPKCGTTEATWTP